MKWPNAFNPALEREFQAQQAEQKKRTEEKEREMRDAKVDPTEELGCQLSPSERVARVFQKMDETDEELVNSWELNFLRGNTQNNFPNFTPKQEAVMQKIEAKVFGELLQPISREYKSEDPQELTGELRFRNRTKR